MEKTIFRNIDDYESFISSHTNRDRSKGPFTDIRIGGPPESYPAILVYEFRDCQNGPDYYTGGYVYLSDFE